MVSELVEKIAQESGLTPKEIRDKIEEKRIELSNLISEEGAAYIVAKELGIDLMKRVKRLFIKNLIDGMRSVEIVGKITNIIEREFETKKGKGKVAIVFLIDETGSIRLTLWNRELEKLKGFYAGDTVRVRGYVRKDNRGGLEFRVGRYGKIEKSSEEITVKDKKTERSSISELIEGQNRIIRGALLQVFKSNPFFQVCPECGSRVKEEEGFACQEHGNVEPRPRLVITGIIDDGTENIRAVFFGENAEKLLGMTTDEAKRLMEKKMELNALFDKIDMGKEFLLTGYVRRNPYFDRMEFIVSNVKNVNVRDEIRSMLRGKEV
jgi:replication factor A1